MDHPKVVFKVLLTDCFDYTVPANLGAMSQKLRVPDWCDGYRDGVNDSVLFDQSHAELSQFKPIAAEDSEYESDAYYDYDSEKAEDLDDRN
jgi:hypothetical protein